MLQKKIIEERNQTMAWSALRGAKKAHSLNKQLDNALAPAKPAASQATPVETAADALNRVSPYFVCKGARFVNFNSFI